MLTVWVCNVLAKGNRRKSCSRSVVRQKGQLHLHFTPRERLLKSTSGIKTSLAWFGGLILSTSQFWPQLPQKHFQFKSCEKWLASFSKVNSKSLIQTVENEKHYIAAPPQFPQIFLVLSVIYKKVEWMFRYSKMLFRKYVGKFHPKTLERKNFCLKCLFFAFKSKNSSLVSSTLLKSIFFLDRWHTRANGLKEGANEMKEFVFASLKSRCEVCPISLFSLCLRHQVLFLSGWNS